MEREKDVEQALVKAVKAAGGCCLKWVSPGAAGVPDRICLFPGGRVVFAEIKRPDGGVFAMRQQVWARKLRRLGFTVCLIQNKNQVRSLVAFEEWKNERKPETVDTCVCCGEAVPEGRMVCRVCENKAEKKDDV